MKILKTMWRGYLPLIIFILLCGLCWRGLYLNPHALPATMINQPVPQFNLMTLIMPSQAVTEQWFKGRVSLVNVWASWCVACEQEHPILMDIALSKKVAILGLNYKDQRHNALAVLTDKGDPFTLIAYDPAGDVAINFGVYGTPETFVVDQQGIIRFKYIGPLTSQVWSQQLWPLIQQLQRTARKDN